ncbi:DUF4430 domain-containing protein [Pseudogracilibacillus auburnensis]|uniref:DUF4430 domain-containing protein n=1 Tax=Pseudogracilibacillus auburnensis TaxID=1494959 RepID=UPI001A9720E3|nr:DUF4430 domain-containing protein [Pseudogracilibacillus auburnensis]MBO1005543.1 DUF4430 domain-containing protein [Pseudogracilibacillus auburnensis]
MNKRILKQFALFFSFLLVFVNLSFIQPQISSAETLDQAVTIKAIDGDGKNVIDTKAVEINDGDTAWDVLQHVADEIDYDEFDYGIMINGINGINSDWDTYQNFWSFIVNGNSASVGTSAYEVKHGDNILFWLTDDMDANITVTVSAMDGEGNPIIHEESVNVTQNSTAYDAIVQVTKKQDVPFDVAVDSTFFTFINNVGDVELAGNQWWEFLIDDQSSQVGVLSHQVQPGEHIQLRVQSFNDGSEEEDEDPEPTPEDNEENDEDENDEKIDEETNENDNNDEKNNEEKPTPEKETPSKKLINQVSKEVDFLANHVLANDLATAFGDEWWVWGLATSGNSVPNSYIKSIEQVVQENEGEFGNVFDLEKVIIALSSSGVDVTNVSGVHLLDKLAEHSGLENPLINAAIFALIAANSGQYEFNEEKENELVQLILESELDGGGWAFFGSKPSADITGMALIALANYKDQPEVKAAIDRAVTYLSNEQASNGGYYDEWNGGYTSETVSQVITGLVAVGVEPTSEPFTKEEGKNLVEHLLEFKTADGLYSHVLGDDESDSFSATPQAFLALSTYKNFVDGEVPPKPIPTEPKEEKPNKNGKVDDTDKTKTPKEENGEEKPPTKKEETDKEKTDNKGDKLPKTATDVFNMFVIGLLVLVVGFVFFMLQRKWKQE